MPEMNGKELYENLAKVGNLRVLYMSGYPYNVISNHGVLEPGINFIQKTFTVISLSKKIRSILDGDKSN
jgi:hypothetical protein